MYFLEETIRAINKLIEDGTSIVDTKRIRRCIKIKSSNRSKINFIWRSLDFLEGEGILEKNGKIKPKTYRIKIKNPIDINKYRERTAYLMRDNYKIIEEL